MSKDLKNAMTVGALIEELRQFDENTPVLFAYDYHDHWRTQVTKEVNNISAEKVTYSDYHSMFKMYQPVDDEDETGDDVHEAVVIS